MSQIQIVAIKISVSIASQDANIPLSVQIVIVAVKPDLSDNTIQVKKIL